MASEKKCVHLTLDLDVYEDAKLRYPNFSGRVNELLREDLNTSDDEEVLMKEMDELKALYKAKKRKLCKIQENREAQAKDESVINSVLEWAVSVYERRGVLGLNILEKECKRKKVSFENVKEILEREDVAFVNFDAI